MTAGKIYIPTPSIEYSQPWIAGAIGLEKFGMNTERVTKMAAPVEAKISKSWARPEVKLERGFACVRLVALRLAGVRFFGVLLVPIFVSTLAAIIANKRIHLPQPSLK